jgi:hypothetical protein
MYVFRDTDGSTMYGPAAYRKAHMSRLGWEWCIGFNSNIAWLCRALPSLPIGILVVLKVLIRLPVTVPTAFLRDPMRFLWNLITLPVFLLLVLPAAVASYYNRRDVFPMAYQWTHGLLAFGHRWDPSENWPMQYEYCRFCGACRKGEPRTLIQEAILESAHQREER